MVEKHLNDRITGLRVQFFELQNDTGFENLALEVFNFQYSFNPIYKKYVKFLGVDIKKVITIEKIPFLPIAFFKTQNIIVDNTKAEITFYSSGTSGLNQSKHFVADKLLYEESFLKAFEYFYGRVDDYCFLALLPNYLEREGSSLVYMVNELMQRSKHPENGFYLDEYEKLASSIRILEKARQKYFLFGVTYALLDFARYAQLELKYGIIMETGGMKGKRKELTKQEVHQKLKTDFNMKNIHSEYGMTELLSQAYSIGHGLFSTPPWMKVLIRDVYDPLSYVGNGSSGGINVIDLANLYSCSFIETKDLGRKYQSDQFEVLGRFDNSDIRGCNLLVN